MTKDKRKKGESGLNSNTLNAGSVFVCANGS